MLIMKEKSQRQPVKLFQDFEVGKWKQVSKQDSERAANAAGVKPEVCDLLDIKESVAKRKAILLDKT